MNREIKFRYYNHDEKIMVYVSFKSIGNIVDDKNIMQYTGLKDKNGKEIYEGDIVKYERFYDDSSVWGFEKAEVTFGFKQLYKLSQIYDEVEVIGNIFENPDLLK